MDRRGFFSSFKDRLAKHKKDDSKPIYPPYLVDVSLIYEFCAECEKPCVDVCDEKIIFIKNNTPTLDFSKNGCTFCSKCADICDKDVLNIKSNVGINARITIKTSDCLAWNGTMCFSCKDTCRDNAIFFFGTFRPKIDENACTNCGLCVSACVVSAISVRQITFR